MSSQERAQGPSLRHARLGHEGAPALDAVGQALGGEPVDLAANGHARDAVTLREQPLRRKRAAGREARDESLEDLAQPAALGAGARRKGRSSSALFRGTRDLRGRRGRRKAPRQRDRVGDRRSYDDGVRAGVERPPHVVRRGIPSLGEHGAVQRRRQALDQGEIGRERCCAARVAGERRRDRIGACGAGGEAGLMVVDVREEGKP